MTRPGVLRRTCAARCSPTPCPRSPPPPPFQAWENQIAYTVHQAISTSRQRGRDGQREAGAVLAFGMIAHGGGRQTGYAMLAAEDGRWLRYVTGRDRRGWKPTPGGRGVQAQPPPAAERLPIRGVHPVGLFIVLALLALLRFSWKEASSALAVVRWQQIVVLPGNASAVAPPWNWP